VRTKIAPLNHPAMSLDLNPIKHDLGHGWTAVATELFPICKEQPQNRWFFSLFLVPRFLN